MPAGSRGVWRSSVSRSLAPPSLGLDFMYSCSSTLIHERITARNTPPVFLPTKLILYFCLLRMCNPDPLPELRKVLVFLIFKDVETICAHVKKTAKEYFIRSCCVEMLSTFTQQGDECVVLYTAAVRTIGPACPCLRDGLPVGCKGHASAGYLRIAGRCHPVVRAIGQLAGHQLRRCYRVVQRPPQNNP